MATGISLPVGVDATGGTAMASDEVQDSQIIRTAIMDCDNMHAYQQDLGIGSAMIFDVDSPETQSRVIRRVKRVFEVFRAIQRFKLIKSTLKIVEGDAGEGEMFLEFEYISLETDEERTFSEALIGLQTQGA